MDRPHRFLCPWYSSGKNTGVGCHFLFQWIFLNQGCNLYLLHGQADSLPLPYLGSLIHERKKRNRHQLFLNNWAMLSAQQVSHTVLGRSSRWAKGHWVQLPQDHIRGFHLLKTHDTSRKPPPHQGWIEPSPQSWLGREKKPSDQDWAHRSAPDEEEEQGLGGPPWRDPCSPHTGHCSPGMTPGGRRPAAAVNPGGPQEAWEPDSSPETRTHSRSWNRVRRQLDIVQDLASLLSSLCAPQPTDTPSVPQFTHPSGQGPAMLDKVGSVEYRAGSDRQDVWTGQGGHWLSERGLKSSVLEISFSISLTVKSFKSLRDKDLLSHRLSDLSSAPVSPPH